MARPTLVARPRSVPERFVCSHTNDGCLVYAATDPQHVYLVAGAPDRPTCTCPDFRAHQAEPGWRCAHILAATNQSHEDQTPLLSDAAEERAATQTEHRPRKRGNGATPNGHSHTQMLLKRSVSPDGRIDALSVEFTCPVDGLGAEAIQARAASTLDLQAQIVRAFAGPKPRTNSGNSHETHDAPPAPQESGRVPARLLTVGGMDGKWGRRLYLNVQVNGRTAKLFGSPKQLQAALATAGFPNIEITEGVPLNLPCQVIAAPSPDGRYLNIVQVFPEAPDPARRPA